MDRRRFIYVTAAAAGVSPFINACTTKSKIPGKIVGANHRKGHLLREKGRAHASSVIKKDIVIVGSGISGLSAARHLHTCGINDFIVLELEKHSGGNAASGANRISAYPWGAHYVPIPNNSLTAYLDFLKECNVVKEFTEEGLPVYNEMHLCFDPEERLYINGRWQEGLVPQFGVPDNDLLQIKSFLERMNDYRYLKTEDGRDAFAIPVNDSGISEELMRLDNVTMKDWLVQNGYTSQYLHEYINYCCRDDFGTPIDKVSAWAGIHYFASRKGKGMNAQHEDVLTWPEGNSFLANKLKEKFADKIQTNTLVTNVFQRNGAVIIEYANDDGSIKSLEARQCILAVPQFVAARLLNDEQRRKTVKDNYQYSPWMVANLSVQKIEERSGVALSWDNVIHNSQSLGYVEATHQLLRQDESLRNITYYLPLTEKAPAEERIQASARTHEEWMQIIVNDLKVIHPDIEKKIISADIMLWGHAMTQPLPDHIFGEVRKKLAASIDDKIHFAHTDLAGISIFEEGFYQGLHAADKVIKLIK